MTLLWGNSGANYYGALPDIGRDFETLALWGANVLDLGQDLNIVAMGKPNVPNLCWEFVPSPGKVDPSVWSVDTEEEKGE